MGSTRQSSTSGQRTAHKSRHVLALAHSAFLTVALEGGRYFFTLQS